MRRVWYICAWVTAGCLRRITKKRFEMGKLVNGARWHGHCSVVLRIEVPENRLVTSINYVVQPTAESNKAPPEDHHGGLWQCVRAPRSTR